MIHLLKSLLEKEMKIIFENYKNHQMSYFVQTHKTDK